MWSHCVLSLNNALYLLLRTCSTVEDRKIIDCDFKHRNKKKNSYFRHTETDAHILSSIVSVAL